MNEFERSLAFRAGAQELQEVKALPLDRLPSIAAVVPSFNQARFLAATLDSILAQGYPKLEVFVADGGSTDGSPALLADYQSRYPKVLRYDSRPDGGHHHGVNKGIEATSAEIIAWINSDDLYLPETFWKVAAFFHFNRTALVVYGRSRYVDESLKPVVDYPVDWSPALREQRRRFQHFCLVPQPSLFFRRAAVKLSGPLASRILDYELWLRWQRDLPFYFYDDYFSLARLHGAAITTNADSRLLRGICDVVHAYYAVVPMSWALRMAYNRAYGAAWTRGIAPPVTGRIKFNAVLIWLGLNILWLPRALRMGLSKVLNWARESLKTSA